MSSVKFVGSVKSTGSRTSVIAAWGLVAGRWEKLYCLWLVLHILYYYNYFLCCLIKLSLSQPTSFTFCPLYPPSPLRQGGPSERLCGPCCRLPG